MDIEGSTEDACEEDVCVVGEDIPFELVGEVPGASTVAEAGHVESLAATRHDAKVSEKNKEEEESKNNNKCEVGLE